MIWVFVQRLGGQVTAAVIFAVLALFLGPEDYGVVGMAGVWIGIISAFSEWGFGSALIQRKFVEGSHLSTVFFVNIGMGAILAASGFALSYPAATFFDDPRVQPVMAVLSLNFITSTLSITQLSLARREMRFKHLAIRDLVASTAGGAVAVTLATLGAGVWSLVAQQLVNGVVGSALLWGLSPWRPRLSEFSRDALTELWPYSSRVFAFSMIKGFTDDADTLIIGYMLGSGPLGLYAFATKLMVPIAQVAGAVGLYLFPKLSRMQDDVKGVAEAYLIVLKAIGGLALPYVLFVALASPRVIPGVWGTKWQGAVPLVGLLAGVALMKALISPSGHLFKAMGKPGWLVRWSVFITVDLVVCILVGSYYGVRGAVAGILVAWLIAFPVLFYMVRQIIGLSTREVLGAERSAMLASIGGALAFFSFAQLPIGSGIASAVGGAMFGLACYATAMWALERPFITYAFRRLFKP